MNTDELIVVAWATAIFLIGVCYLQAKVIYRLRQGNDVLREALGALGKVPKRFPHNLSVGPIAQLHSKGL